MISSPALNLSGLTLCTLKGSIMWTYGIKLFPLCAHMLHYVDSTDCFSGVHAYAGWIQAS